MRLLLPSVTFAQGTAPSPAAVAEVERVIVTGSNIPTAEETGPNPVDTYRPADLEKLGIRNATDLLTNLPQEMGSTVNQNAVAGGDGSVLIPFPMIDHIDILKDGASAVYGSDAVAGVINIFLIHKFRGLEIGGSMGNTNLGASNDARELEGWLKAGVGDDKTDILVIADFYDRAAMYARDRQLTSNTFAVPWGGVDKRLAYSPGHIGAGRFGFRLIPKLFFSANSPPPHSAPNVSTSPFYIRPGFPANVLAGLPVANPNAYPGPPGIIGPCSQTPPTDLGHLWV